MTETVKALRELIEAANNATLKDDVRHVGALCIAFVADHGEALTRLAEQGAGDGDVLRDARIGLNGCTVAENALGDAYIAVRERLFTDSERDALTLLYRAAIATAAPTPPTTPQQAEGRDGWIPWRGGKCPVDDSTVVDVRLRDGGIHLGDPASYWDWNHDDTCDPILAYRPAALAEQQENDRG